MAKITTTTFYHNGYNAASDGKPRRSPHRDGTGSDSKWLEGYNAFIAGGAAPEEPRKRRSKEEMAEVKSNPLAMASDFNNPTRELPSALIIKKYEPLRVNTDSKPRTPTMLDKIFELKNQIKTETDSEMLELLYMELADLEWLVSASMDDKPSENWDEYKSERGLTFDKVAA